MNLRGDDMINIINEVKNGVKIENAVKGLTNKNG